MWIPLLEYAVKKGVSLSTLRRHIKANKVLYKVENGRYLLHDADASERGEHDSGGQAMGSERSVTTPAPLRAMPVLGKAAPESITKLETDLQRAREEIAELKTLIAFYEEQMAPGRFGNN